MRRAPFWVLLAAISVASTYAGIRYFPQAFSIVALNITMDRERALTEARAIMTRDRLGPPGYRQAASFGGDEEAQTFVELEGGGKEALTGMLREGLYASYTWRVRQFAEGETNETTLRFTPDGRPYGFAERLKEDAPGAALTSEAARQIAETGARERWHVDLAPFTLVEPGQERRPGGRVDHTFTYERAAPTLNEGRYRLRLVVSGDRLTEVTHFIRVPEAFTRRYASMRSANEAIGIGSVVGMALLYVVGGIGVGLFFMLRKRWVVWRPAIIWGAVVSLLQALAALNEFPLAWMTYDTALPRSTFVAQQLSTIVAMFIGFTVFFALSFMAAETLSRRAFGGHPQFWKVWSKGPGQSVTVLGLTVAGLLLVSVFFAYDVVLYLVMTKVFGWWSPAEALLHPDVLATYAPWLSAIANSFQAGFWEEALFRAVPLAGAALIGERFGQRRLFLILGFVVQAIVFGAGHAPYPNQPAYARPVELIIPSIGFGLLYVYFGLLPGIILHFTFDVVWFALPIFMAEAPGIWFQQLMVVVWTLVPLWIVIVRRMQAGRWSELSPEDRNAAWTPPPVPERPAPAAVTSRATLPARSSTVWMAAGLLGLAAVVVLAFSRDDGATLAVTRQHAADLARQALVARGVTLGPTWRVMPIAEDGTGGAHEFISETAGESRRQSLVGVYLSAARWRVRVATFEGDIDARAEEWDVVVRRSGEVGGIRHTLPQSRPGPSLDEAAARQLARATIAERFHLDAERGQAREVSARPDRLNARTDWTFTFVDTTIPPLPKGEPRMEIRIAGDEVTAAMRFVFVPEDWQRADRAVSTRNLIAQVGSGLVLGMVLVAAAVSGVIMWSRRRYMPRLFLASSAVVFVVSVARTANSWPTVQAAMVTAAPVSLQLAGVIGIGLVALTVSAVMTGLAIGALPHRLAGAGTLPDREALRLGVAVGLAAAAVWAAAAWLRTPAWARVADLDALGTTIAPLQVAIDPVTSLLSRIAVLVTVLAVADQYTAGWTRRRTAGILSLAVIGFLCAGAPAGHHVGGWLAAGALLAAALPIAALTALRFDATMTPIALAAMMAAGALSRGAGRAFPGALAGSFLAAALLAATGWWMFRALRRWRAAVA